MANRIEPCPFCHSQHLHINLNGTSYCVVCESCRSKGPHRVELQHAIDQWNLTSGLVPHQAPPGVVPAQGSGISSRAC